MRPYLFLSGLALMYLGSALAQSVPPARTGKTLAEACSSNEQSFVMRCTAYLGGVADGMDFLSVYQKTHESALNKSRLTLKPFMFCHDQPWSAETLRQTYVQWANSNPSRMQDDQYVVAVDALHDTFPCK
ncbi:MAG: Rap1a/Tai family immunity protein [Alphaproteobacteria bacterium]|nr:Rap1a/Tai family immunity protein [Alphaproteobacteria bacterium]